MAIRNDNEAYRYVSFAPIYPKFKATDTLHRNGFKDDLYKIAPTDLIPALLTDSRAETLMKAGRIEHLRYFLSKAGAFDAYFSSEALNNTWQPYKISVRNGYEITDFSLWCDYVDMLRRLNKDIHNPKYLCPTDLKAEHDRRETELRRQREKEEIERKRKKAMEDEKRFQELKSKFFGIRFTDGTIQVHVLESVQEHLEEAVSMHHCVLCKGLHNVHYANQTNM